MKVFKLALVAISILGAITVSGYSTTAKAQETIVDSGGAILYLFDDGSALFYDPSTEYCRYFGPLET